MRSLPLERSVSHHHCFGASCTGRRPLYTHAWQTLRQSTSHRSLCTRACCCSMTVLLSIAFRFRFTCRIRSRAPYGSRAGVGSRRTVIGAVDGAFNCLLHLLDALEPVPCDTTGANWLNCTCGASTVFFTTRVLGGSRAGVSGHDVPLSAPLSMAPSTVFSTF